jgi:RecJ-like exonuclease
MTCSSCGGSVEWKGPLANLTHTQCVACGAVNSQVPEPVPEDEDEDEDEEYCETCEMCEGDGLIYAYDEDPIYYKRGELIRCPQCGGTGLL